jgi:NADH:ubiquinone oxidoreductase subunit 6 (subunit J)
MIAALFFYLFAGVCVASAFMVIAARNLELDARYR